MAVNVLWPFVPAAIAIHFARPDLHVWDFVLNYIAMVPTANLVGFAGQELARKLPKVIGVLLETFLGGIVEIVLFMMRTHHGLYDSVFEKDEEKDHDRHLDLLKDKLTLTECVIALVLALTCVSMHAVFLVEEIEYIVIERGVSDSFMGLILVPQVEKVAEHLTAVDEAWDNQMNFALAHILGATIQTALFNSSLVVIVGWGLGKAMDLNFEVFNIVILIMAIIVVGNFLRDQKSNYLEGSLCILIYVIIAIASWYYPNPNPGSTNTSEMTGSEGARRL
ncbi:Ca2+:H+ antiporter, partial [Lecanoromycetidae sp. Uapishka_2]